jgi:mannose-6-phosphate isomerase-like protein (cupin superfamily)
MRTIVFCAFALVSAVSAQEGRPSCDHCSSTYINGSELLAYLNRVPPATGVSDQQVRAVDVGKSHVDIGVVYRGKLKGNSPVAEHNLVSEVYYVLDGSATLVTGPDIEGLKPRPADDWAVKMLNGPGANGTTIRNGATHELKAGDMIVIPAGTGHWFTKIDDHIRYVMVRIDPDKVTPLKDEAASKADLRAGFDAGNRPGNQK